MNSSISSGFGKRIRQLRKRFGLSVPKFAAQLGFDRSYVFRLENGDADNPSLKFIESVVQKFGVDREWLIGGVGDGNSLRVDVVPYRSGIDGHIRNRLECLRSIIEGCNDDELNEAHDRFNKLAKKDKRLGKIFAQVSTVISCMIMRRMMKNQAKPDDKPGSSGKK
jgi:transcriptional regulator with XRE-family HTH domain